MDEGKKQQIRGIDRTVLSALCIGPVFWVIDSIVKVYFFNEGTFLHQIFSPSPFSLWMRLFVVIIMGLFSIVFISHKSFMAKLTRDENKYKSLFEYASDAILLADTNGNLIEANKKAESLLGYSKQDLSRMNFMQLHPNDELAKVLPALKGITKEKGCSLHDTAIVKKDGTITPVDMSASLIESCGERYIQGIIRDEEKALSDIETIMRQRQKGLNDTQEALQEKEQQLQRLEKALEDERKQMAEDAAKGKEQAERCILLEETVKKKDAEMISREEVVRQKEQGLLLKEEQYRGQETLLQAAEERIKTLEASLQMKESQGALEAQSSTDTQTRISALEEIVRNREAQITSQLSKMLELEEKVKSLSQSLKQAEAQQIQARVPQAALPAENATYTPSSRMAAVGQFANGVALEMSSPLTNIVNNVMQIRTEIQLKGDCAPADLKNILSSVEESALRCKTIVQILTALARPAVEVLQPVSLNDVINKMAALVEGRLRLQNVTIKKQFQLNAPSVLGNAHYLQLIIFNFLICARWSIYKKSPKEGGTITITTSFFADSNLVSCAIADTGITVPKEDLARVFEPFYISKLLGEETGLDLSYAKKVIVDCQGTIEAANNETQGTTIKFFIPAVKEEETVGIKKG